jgi:glutathione peroxidase
MLLNSLLLFAFLFKTAQADVPASIYDYKVAALDGTVINMADFKGKKILIVNTASKCKFTAQYEALEKLYLSHKDKLVIVGFPSNNFFFQEPAGNEQIAEFCTKNYGVTFPMAAKISVKGKNKAPIYTWLTEKRYNHFEDSRVKWNFQKYLIDEEGKLVAIYYSNTPPDSPEVLAAIEK